MIHNLESDEKIYQTAIIILINHLKSKKNNVNGTNYMSIFTK